MCDVSAKTEHYAAHFFRVSDEGFIKYLQGILTKGSQVLSDNTRYGVWMIKKEMDHELIGRGKVDGCGVNF